jgi:hypothetical protein
MGASHYRPDDLVELASAFERSLTSRQRLAYLLKRDMGVDVDPGALGEFIKRNWRMVQCLRARDPR